MEVVDISLAENLQHVVELSTEEDCKRLVNSHKKVVIKFYADWCGPCKRISRLYEVYTLYFIKTRNSRCNFFHISFGYFIQVSQNCTNGKVGKCTLIHDIFARV